MRILGAHDFWPLGCRGAPICHGGRPLRREYAGMHYSELKLKPLALIAQVWSPAFVHARRETEIFFAATFLRFLPAS
jgi:hypothetical protein